MMCDLLLANKTRPRLEAVVFLARLCYMAKVTPMITLYYVPLYLSRLEQEPLFSEKTRRGPWGPEDVTVITVEKKFKRQYHEAVYVHLGSFLSYRFIDLTLNNIPRALRTELWAR